VAEVVRRLRENHGTAILRGLSFDLATANGTDHAAEVTAAWVRKTMGEASVRLALPDRAGRLRIASGDGDPGNPGRRRSARRRQALLGRRPIRLDLHDGGQRTLGVFPLFFGDVDVGVLEVAAPREAFLRRWDLVETIAALLAASIWHLSERRRQQRDIEILQQAAGLGLDLLRAGSQSGAVREAVRFMAKRFEIPVAGWVAAPGSGRYTLTSVRGLGARKRRELRMAFDGTAVRTALPSEQREALIRRFGDVLGTRDVAVIDARSALLLAAYAPTSTLSAMGTLGTLLEGILELLALAAHAERRNEQLDMGIAWTAHELRAPLLGVKAVLELLLRGDTRTPITLAMLRRSLRELEQLAETTEGLLGWAVGARPLRRRTADVVRLVDEAVRSCELEQLAETTEGLLGWAVGARPLRRRTADVVRLVDEAVRSCELEGGEERVQVSADGPAMALVDSAHFRRAVANVVRNALIYSAGDTKVSVGVGTVGDLATVTVTDQGPGIPEAERSWIFDPFMRGSNGGRSDRGSTGLGLFIARRIVEAHEGRIWVDSSRKGTTFTLQVPSARARRSAS